jgi:[ribosomal protein S18]-alanine N-acetyltransferase
MITLFLNTLRKLSPQGRGKEENPTQADSFSIRPMKIEDLEQVHAIDTISFSLPWPLSSYRFELLENPGSMLWVAEATSQDGLRRVAGMIVIWMIVDEAHIATIAVHPDFRGHGIGKLLLARALIEATHLGANQATLEVRVGNTVAQSLYQKFGFQVVGRRIKYYQDNNEDALIMTVHHLKVSDLEHFSIDESHYQEV